MLSKNKVISEGFLKVPKNKFKFEKQKEANSDNESILSSFSDVLDNLIKKDITNKQSTNNQQINKVQKDEQKEEKNKLTQKKQKPFTPSVKD